MQYAGTKEENAYLRGVKEAVELIFGRKERE